MLFEVDRYDVQVLLHEWRWLIGRTDKPLFVSVFGDWVMNRADGSIWVLSTLEGSYQRVARDSVEYDVLRSSDHWLEKTFLAGWQLIAELHGLEPMQGECLGWKLHPLLGGAFEPSNLACFDMHEYQSRMGQLHRQLQSVGHTFGPQVTVAPKPSSPTVLASRN